MSTSPSVEAGPSGADAVPDNAERPTIRNQPRILSLDGGGVRGLSSLLILKNFMEEIGRQAGHDSTPLPCEYFDLIGGTSTGGLIAIMLGRLRMSVGECIANYLELSKEVFNIDRAIVGVIPTRGDRARFDATRLETVIKKIIKEKLGDPDIPMHHIPLSDTQIPCPTFVVATSGTNADGPAVMFRSYGCKGFNADNCAIWEAARCTSAAPSFFRPMFVKNPPPGGWFIDGGIRNNNPSDLALDEARRIWPTVKRFCVVSIGTGRQKSVDFNTRGLKGPESNDGKLKGWPRFIPRLGWGIVTNTKELAKIMNDCVDISTSCEPTHERMLRTSKSPDPDLQFPYFRFNVERGMDSIGLQEWKASTQMSALTLQYMREGATQGKRNACVRYLLNPPDAECKQPIFDAADN